jgi:hypothetical protein
MVDYMDQRILKELNKNDAVFLVIRYFPLSYNNDSEHQQADQKKKDAMQMQFIQEHYFDVIGAENLKRFKCKPKGNCVVVEVTKNGYENLKNKAKYRSIKLYDMGTYGEYDGFR